MGGNECEEGFGQGWAGVNLVTRGWYVVCMELSGRGGPRYEEGRGVGWGVGVKCDVSVKWSLPLPALTCRAVHFLCLATCAVHVYVYVARVCCPCMSSEWVAVTWLCQIALFNEVMQVPVF